MKNKELKDICSYCGYVFDKEDCIIFGRTDDCVEHYFCCELHKTRYIGH